MKVILEFNLPEESEEHELHMKGPEFHYVLWEFSNYLRNQLKYGDFDDDNKPNVYETLESVRDEFFRILESRGVSL